MVMAAADRLLTKAAEHYNAGRANEAGALCGDILSGHPDHIPALHLGAMIAFSDGRMSEGSALLGRVFARHPNHVPAWIALGDALAVKGEREGAMAAFLRAVTLRPKDAGLHAKLGSALTELSRFEDAEAAYRYAIALDPALIRARFNLGAALTAQQRLDEAEQVYRDVVARSPRHRDAWLNLGNVLIDQGKLDDAITVLRRALTAEPDDARLHCSLGAALYRQGRLEEAIVHYDSAVVLAPSDASALRLLALIMHEAGRQQEAVRIYQQNLALEPDDVVLLSDFAVCLCDLRRYDEAITACEQALALKPDHAPAHTNLGIILETQDLTEAAAAAHRCAITADPSYAKGHANLAVALRNLGLIDEALAASHRAVALAPDDPLIRYNHAHFLLLCGDFASGFADHQRSRRRKLPSEDVPTFDGPEWQGESFAGRTLLLYSEYGMGDALHFIRYLPDVLARGGSVVLQVQPALASLFRTLPGIVVFARGEVLPDHDLQLPLMELPRLFGTTLETIPANVPYLHADPAKVKFWRRILGDTASLKVGVAWAGNPKHKCDRQRSVAAEMLLPRLVTAGVQLYSLQKEVQPADASVLAELGAGIIDLAPVLGDFTDTAAAVAALDLVISVDTSVAHLAGALGRPCWMLLPYALDWRWLRDREDTPWYPSMRLLRQSKPQAWDDVMARAAAELARVVAGERDLLRPPAG